MKLPGLSKDRAANVGRVEQVFSASFVQFQFRFVDFLVRHLSDVGQAFHGDFEKMMIVAVLGQSRLASVVQAMSDGLEEAVALAVPNGMTATQVAEILGLPRQTVRRKLVEIQSSGWIIQSPNRQWSLAVNGQKTQIEGDLSEVNRRGIARVAELFVDLASLLEAKRDEVERRPALSG